MSEHKISHPDMVRKLFKDSRTINLSPEQTNLLHAAVGLAGEAGEAVGVVISDPKGLLEDTRTQLVGELGDLEFYLEAFRQGAGLTREPTADGLPSNLIGSTHLAAELACYATALLDLVKKQVFNNREGLRPKIVQTLEMLEYVAESIRRRYDITRQETLDANIAKLGARYDGFEYSDEAAAARRDEK